MDAPKTCIPAWRGWPSLIVRAVVLHGLLCGTVQAEQVPASMASVLTNCPTIRHLLLEAQFFSPRSTLVVFKYQQGAFYGRQLSGPDPSSVYFNSPKDTSAGRWGDEYWYLQPSNSRRLPPVLTTSFGLGVDRDAMRTKCGMFENIFSYFATFGITPEGVNLVKIEGDLISSVVSSGHPGETTTTTTSLIVSNGIAIGGRVQPRTARGLAKPLNLTYLYDTNTVPLPFPKEIVLTQRVPRPEQPEDSDPEVDGIDRTLLHLIVKEIQVETSASLQPREMFMPDARLLGTNSVHLVITNGQNYQLKSNQLFSIDIPQEQLNRDLRRGRFAQPWLTVAFVAIAFIVPILIVVRQQRKNQQRKAA